MICQYCKTELEANGLQSYGRTLDENFCCVCWFNGAYLLDFDQPDIWYNENINSPFIDALEDDGYISDSNNQPDRIMGWMKKTIAACDEEIASLESEIEGIRQKRERLDEKRFDMEQWLPDWEARQKEDVAVSEKGMALA